MANRIRFTAEGGLADPVEVENYPLIARKAGREVFRSLKKAIGECWAILIPIVIFLAWMGWCCTEAYTDPIPRSGLSSQMTETTAVKVAHTLIYDHWDEYYISRADALMMDDHPEVREALDRMVVRDGLMYGYQANLFHDGFGQACRALQIARECIQDSKRREGPDYPIHR